MYLFLNPKAVSNKRNHFIFQQQLDAALRSGENITR